ncbi:MAG TPA: hypothetical protein VK619_06790 [Pyrinomonadaceae bacterium]|nr:hypothetical protein [Pyrinomonadaceae bacterium]
MFCQKCGAADQTVDSYCKRCGEWLPDPSQIGRRRGKLGARTPEERNRKMRVMEALSALFAIGSLLVIVGVLAGTLNKSVLVVAADFSIVIVIFQVLNFLIGRSLQTRLKRGRAEEIQAEKHIKEEENIPQLNAADYSSFVPPASVTENTTEILESVPRAQGKRQSRN